TRFNGVKLNAHSTEFVSHCCKRMRALHVHHRRSREIDYYQLWRGRLDMNTAQDRVAYIVDVKVDEDRFWSEDHYVWNQFVVFMAVAIRETAGAGNPPEQRDVRA